MERERDGRGMGEEGTWGRRLRGDKTRRNQGKNPRIPEPARWVRGPRRLIRRRSKELRRAAKSGDCTGEGLPKNSHGWHWVFTRGLGATKSTRRGAESLPSKPVLVEILTPDQAGPFTEQLRRVAMEAIIFPFFNHLRAGAAAAPKTVQGQCEGVYGLVHEGVDAYTAVYTFGAGVRYVLDDKECSGRTGLAG